MKFKFNKTPEEELILKKLQTRLLRIIRREDWDNLLDELDASGRSLDAGVKAKQILLKALLSLKPSSGQNALHVVCRYHPPVGVLTAIVSICPSCTKGVDNNGYTPLHTAVSCGASLKVINKLILWYPEAAAVKDNRGRYPLHLCCQKGIDFEACCDTSSDESSLDGKLLEREPQIGEIIASIAYAAPHVITQDDEDGLSALEYAIQNGFEYRVVRKLQKFSVAASKVDAKNRNKHTVRSKPATSMQAEKKASKGRLTQLRKHLIFF